MNHFCIDTSVWHNTHRSSVGERVAEKISNDVVSICDQVTLEILYSARSAQDYDALFARLGALHQVPTESSVLKRAIDVQRQLAKVGGLHHRSVKIADLIIAASAELANDTVWHYDEDFDRIAMVTGQRTEWVVPRGSI
jgi:predicted nucleic acid-binding protein